PDPEGRFLAVTFQTGTVAVWDRVENRAVFSASRSTDRIPSVAFSPDPDNPSIAFPRGKEVTIERWRGTAGPEVHTFRAGSPLSAVAFSRDGNYLGGATEGGTVSLWDARTLQNPDAEPLRVLRGHRGGVTDLAFSPNSQRVATAGS